MSNYPAGMTSSDIPGWDEREMEIYTRCDAPDAEVRVADLDNALITVSWIKKLIENEINQVPPPKGLAPNLERALQKVNEIKTTLSYKTTATVDYCPFEGDVESVFSGRTVYWKCPICSAEHEDDSSIYETDPSEYYDGE